MLFYFENILSNRKNISLNFKNPSQKVGSQTFRKEKISHKFAWKKTLNKAITKLY